MNFQIAFIFFIFGLYTERKENIGCKRLFAEQTCFIMQMYLIRSSVTVEGKNIIQKDWGVEPKVSQFSDILSFGSQSILKQTNQCKFCQHSVKFQLFQL